MLTFKVEYDWLREHGYIQNFLAQNKEFYARESYTVWLLRGKGVWEYLPQDIRDNSIAKDQASLRNYVEGELNNISTDLFNFFDDHFHSHPSLNITVQLTRYGTGGSYHGNTMVVDVFRLFPRLGKTSLARKCLRQLKLRTLGPLLPWVVIHELVHMYIEEAVRQAGLHHPDKHWQKEWLVDEILMSDELQRICKGNWRQRDSVPPPSGIAVIPWKRVPTWATPAA